MANKSQGPAFTFERRKSARTVQINDQERVVQNLQKMAQGACIAIFASVAIVLCAWLLHRVPLVARASVLLEMNPMTAIALGILALALWLRRSETSSNMRRRIAQACALLVTAVGVMGLAGFVLPDLNDIVNSLFLSSASAGTQVPPNTAFSFILLGLAVFALDAPSARVQQVCQYATFVAVAISTMALLGYAYHVDGFYQMAAHSPMAIHTALTCLLLCAAVLFMRPSRGSMALLCSDTMGGVMSRRLLPACLTFPALLGLMSATGQRLGLYSDAAGAAGVVLVVTALLLFLVWRSAVLLVRMEGDRRQVEVQLQKAKAAAETANQLKSAFFANISHEIRTPLTAIVGFADLFFTPTRSDQEKVDCVDRIRRNGEHMLTIINDILDLSKIEAGKFRVETLVCSPVEIIAGVASMLRAKALNKNLKLEVAYEGLIPKLIRTDPTRLRQALINLVSNAIKFTETGGVQIVASMASSPLDAKPIFQIKVIDTGMGIDIKQQELLFQSFVQADATMTRRFGGTGLGLSITRHLAGLLGGNVTLSSEVGKGSTFTLTIETGSLQSVAMLENPKEALLPAPARKDEARSIKLKGSILVAEDGSENQALISAYLKEAGATVEMVGNGQLAVERALSAGGRLFDLIFMDIQMPVMDGFRATLQLREKGCRTPIVALTANAMPTDRERCLNVGCNDFVTKPIDPANLLKTAARYLKLSPSAAGTTASAAKAAPSKAA